MTALPKPMHLEASDPVPTVASANAGAPPDVVQASAGDLEAWDSYVLWHEEATIFHLSGWHTVIARALGHDSHLLMAQRGRRICGMLPLIHVKSRLFGNSLISMGFCVQGGILADDAEAARSLAHAAAQLGQRLGVDYVELRHREPLVEGWATKSDTYATFVAHLPEDEEANLKMIPRKKRADVRKGIKNAALTVDPAAPLEAFYHCYATSVRNLGTPVQSIAYYRAIAETFGDRVEISTVNGPDGPVCGLMSFYFRDTVLPYFGGALPEARRLHAYDFMYWALMRRAVARGCTRFDFGRSKVGTGAYDYKTFWGFEPTPLHYQYHLVRAREVPDINPNNPKYRILVRAWQRLPLSVANRLGPWVARQLG